MSDKPPLKAVKTGGNNPMNPNTKQGNIIAGIILLIIIVLLIALVARLIYIPVKRWSIESEAEAYRQAAETIGVEPDSEIMHTFIINR